MLFRSIAIALLEAGLKVTILETTINAAAGAEARIRAVHARQYGAGRLSQRDIEGRMRRLAYTYRYEKMAEVDLVIEAVFEDIDVKREVFRSLSPHVRRDCILASNTSALDIELLADEVDAPERVLGLHFFNPVPVLPLVELVSTLVTDEAAAARTEEFASAVLGKQVVRCSDRSGFVVNALLVP